MPRRATPTLLLTRPEADSRRFAAMLPDLPHVISPILRILPVAHDAARLASAEALVFTSQHAIAIAGPGRGRTAFCVGPRTAALAREAGYAVIEGPGDAERLQPMLEASDLPLLHPHGRHVARELPVAGMVVYDQLPLPLNARALELLAGAAPVILPLFSPRSARLLAVEAAGSAAPVWLAAISGAALAAWQGPFEQGEIAPTPDARGLAAAIGRLTGGELS
ncbi:uroporphyrinogen-III synthase [Paracoccus marinaquae]|uniref:Uroporphyrinogen-III synthase n=1 Tax=Paracoccus marinaquae TaxID=2841926 RepID=A0ABS6AF74_9RHOB|nr:uroporphyrinogen-III synthase [Paracoccus marinaquae]MBU3028597.1 uroporphyrinogen-III synthase [Paracoccus marinaquae]